MCSQSVFKIILYSWIYVRVTFIISLLFSLVCIVNFSVHLKFSRCVVVYIYFPFIGWLYDALHSYNPGFYVSGITIAASGVMLFFIPSLQRYLAQHRISHSSQKSAVHQNGNSVHSLAWRCSGNHNVSDFSLTDHMGTYFLVKEVFY